MSKAGQKFSVLVFCFSVLVTPSFALDPQSDAAAYFEMPTAKKAEINWILNCQGCHKIDGTGQPDKGLPDLTDVSRFLHVAGGREYLSRVPGVTNASVNDQELTDLMNWLVLRFDPEHIPEGHTPYTFAEVSQWRQKPLSIGAGKLREDLLEKIAKKNQTKGEKNGL